MQQERLTSSTALLNEAGRPPRALFIDRWGTLLEQPQAGYHVDFKDVTFVPGAIEALYKAQRAGWHIYLIGNEDQVAMGEQTDDSWTAFETQLLMHLEEQGVVPQRIYAAVDRLDGVGPHQRDSVFSLPNTGSFYQAQQLEGVDLENSWVIGDSTLELVAGWRAGLYLAGVSTGEALRDGSFDVEVDLQAPDLPSAISKVLQVQATC